MDSIVHGVTSSRTLLSRLHFHFLYCKASQVALEVKNPPANAGDIRDLGSIPRIRRSPGEENGNPHQYYCLENFMDRGASWAYRPWSCKESNMTEAENLPI